MSLIININSLSYLYDYLDLGVHDFIVGTNQFSCRQALTVDYIELKEIKKKYPMIRLFVLVNALVEQKYLDDLKKSLRNDTILVSVMCINNEVGSIQPIEEIKNVLKDHPLVKFHVDMVQALGKIKIDLKGIDCASFSAHKINGLKGSGLLFKRKSTTLVPLINGGQQEFGLRGGTSNACTYIVLAKTLRLALENFDQKEKYVSKLSKYLIKELQTIPDVIINTGGKVSSHIVNFSCIGYKPEVILHALEEKDILISTRSACSSKTSDVSRVMQQLHLPDEVAKSALRVSISNLTKEEEIDKFIYCLKEVLDSIKKQR